MARPHDQDIQSSYPAELDTFTHLKDLDDKHNKVHRELQRGLEAVQTTLGRDAGNVNPGAVQNHADKHSGLGSMMWQANPGTTGDAMVPPGGRGSFITAESLGVLGDGTDETEAVQAAVDEAVKTDAVLVWPGRRYGNQSTRVVKVSDTIFVPSPLRMLGGTFAPFGAGAFADDGTGRPKVMFNIGSRVGGLSHGWWEHGTINGDTHDNAIGAREGIGVSISWHQPSSFRHMTFNGWKAAMHVDGQVGRLDTIQFSKNDIGILVTGQCLSMNAESMSFVGGQQSCVMYDGTRMYFDEGVDVGAGFMSFRNTHIEARGNHNHISFDIGAARGLVIDGPTWVSSGGAGAGGSPTHTFFRMRDNVSASGHYQSNYVIRGPVLMYSADDAYTFIRDDYRDETITKGSLGGSQLFMGEHSRSSE